MQQKAYQRTTVDLPVELHRRLRGRAAEEGTTVKALLVSGAESVLSRPAAEGGKRVKFPLIRSRRPGSVKLTNEDIYNIIGFP